VGAFHRVAPILVRHAVMVLLAEVSEIDRNLESFQRVAFEVGVDREQLWLRVPAGVVERPVIPPRVGVNHLLFALESHRFDAN
jgi:hypothetical protein